MGMQGKGGMKVLDFFFFLPKSTSVFLSLVLKTILYILTIQPEKKKLKQKF